MDREAVLAAYADPATSEDVLLGLPVDDDDTWLALATCAAATPRVLEVIVHLTGAFHLNRETMLGADIALVVGSQPGLTRGQLLEYACRLGGKCATEGIAAATSALADHPACDDAVLIELYSPRIHTGEFEWTTAGTRASLADNNRPGAQAALAGRGHPLAAAMVLLRYTELSWMGAGYEEIDQALADVRAGAAAAGVPEAGYVDAVLRLAGPEWTGTAEQLLAAVAAVLAAAG